MKLHHNSQKLRTKHFTFLLFKEDVVVTLIRIVDDEFQSLLGVYFFILWTSTSLRVVV